MSYCFIIVHTYTLIELHMHMCTDTPADINDILGCKLHEETDFV